MKKIIAGLLGVCLLLTLCSCRNGNRLQRWQEQYDLGVRYLEEGNYAEAIIAFSAAIEIDPRQAPAYVGRGDAYLGSALFDEAIADYLEAIRLDKEVPEYYLRLSDGYLAIGDLDAAIEALEEGYDVTDSSMLRRRMKDLDHISVFQGGVFAWGEDYLDSPIPDAIVTLRDTVSGAVVLSYKTDDDGLYHGYAVDGKYEFFAHAEGYQSALINKSIGEDETVYVENLYLLPEGEDGSGTIRGTIYSAVTGEPIEGAEVWAVANWNQEESGRGEVFQVVSDSEGGYVSPEQRIGYYTVFASCDGYVTSSVNVVASGSYEANWDIMLSPRLAEGEELRIVLTWGSTPEDLDSHLIMDYGDWEEGMWTWGDAFFGSMAIYDDDYELVAALDVDDTSSYGPETITVYRMAGHSFTYVVHDYTNGAWTGSTALSGSEAQIVVYGANGILGTFHVPVNMPGNLWVVFTVNESGVLQGVGEMTDYVY